MSQSKKQYLEVTIRELRELHKYYKDGKNIEDFHRILAQLKQVTTGNFISIGDDIVYDTKFNHDLDHSIRKLCLLFSGNDHIITDYIAKSPKGSLGVTEYASAQAIKNEISGIVEKIGNNPSFFDEC